MLLENSGWQRAKQLEEEMRKSSLVHMAISTAKTIIYYTPVVFLTRYFLNFSFAAIVDDRKML
jgi:hypothetical protein